MEVIIFFYLNEEKFKNTFDVLQPINTYMTCTIKFNIVTTCIMIF